MNLGELIDRLKRSPQDNGVRISGMGLATPLRVMSYRGYYEDLAIDPNREANASSTSMPVVRLVSLLESAIGKEFFGYKGGEFIMTRSTRVWVSDWGSATGWRVYAVEDVKNHMETYTSIVTLEDHYS